MLSRKLVLLVAVALLESFEATAFGQTIFASLTGTVVDSSGAVIPNAKITAIHLGSNVKRVVESNQLGNYTVAQLNEGVYEVRVQAAGFKEFVARNVSLVSRDVRRLDVTLQVGSVEITMEVTGGATLIETETARISDTKTATHLKTLPLNASRIWEFLALSPNVLQTADESSVIRFAGSHYNQSNFSIDGTSIASAISNKQVGPTLNRVESFQEMRIDMVNNSAEFGTIGQLTMISKTGTNSLRGSVFDYYSTPWFKARNPFALARPTGIAHAPGGSVGGPVCLPGLYDGRNKTFFFTAYETTFGSQVNQLLNPTVPLEPWRSGDFSALGSLRIYDPQSSQPFPGNRIPASRINPVSIKIQDRFYPLPNSGDPNVLQSRNYQEMKTRPFDKQPSIYWTARADHHFSERDSMFGRFNMQRLHVGTYEGNLPTIGRRKQQRDTRAATIAYTHTFRPTLLNEFRWGHSSDDNQVNGPIDGTALAKDFGLVGLAPDLPGVSGILKVNWSGIGLQPIAQANRTRYRNNRLEFQEHLSWFRGRHSLKAGFQFTRAAAPAFAADGNLFGSLTFSNRFTSGGLSGQGHPYADFLLGIPASAARAFPPLGEHRVRWEYDLFVIDDFKVNSKLTLNLGLRYELHPPWHETSRQASMFDVVSGSIVVPDGVISKVSPLFPKGYVGIVEATSLELPEHALIRTDKKNFAPRIGIAYRPWGNRTVFRAGYGIFYDSVPPNLTLGGVPFLINEPTYTNPLTNPAVVLPRVFPATGTAGPSTVSLPTAFNPDLKVPYSMQYNFTIERQQWSTGFRLSYIGTNTRQALWSYDYNSPAPDTRPFVDKPRPFPRYPRISYQTNGAGHQYNGLTAEAERPVARGLYFQGSWTWARDIADLEEGQLSENPFDRSRERAVDPSTPTHRVTTNMIYQFPFGKGRHWLSGVSRLADLAVGGWEMSAVYAYYSGQFLTPLWTGSDPTGTAYTSSRTPAVVTIRPDHLFDANLPGDQRSINRWFNPAAFSPPQLGRFGSAAKGVIKGPAANVWHVGVFKTFALAERRPELRWELTATNIFNHPNYSNPATNISQVAGVGVITGVGGVNGYATGDAPGPRVLRMGVRVEW